MFDMIDIMPESLRRFLIPGSPLWLCIHQNSYERTHLRKPHLVHPGPILSKNANSLGLTNIGSVASKYGL